MLMSKSLSVLSLHANNFDGDIPFSFPEGYGLQSLNLYGNKMEGLLPRSLMNCSLLEVLNFGDNKIANLRLLVLRSNKFHGFVVSTKERPSFPKLRVLDLSDNDFFGPLPVPYMEIFKAIVDPHRDDNFSQYMMTHGTRIGLWLLPPKRSFGFTTYYKILVFANLAPHHFTTIIRQLATLLPILSFMKGQNIWKLIVIWKEEEKKLGLLEDVAKKAGACSYSLEDRRVVDRSVEEMDSRTRERNRTVEVAIAATATVVLFFSVSRPVSGALPRLFRTRPASRTWKWWVSLPARTAAFTRSRTRDLT
ncbi:hypothetical protein SLEP1_g54703 [Rubroshorea leprosula]|uniref:Uncharacterized protein n=1 Tax=Rubroshorea leprosula TaxID=152421 RepID=A0AAV5MFS2_9ROSI|nr:hypothetical protein SLEP1_g54703 [Rubroshorea leprosula]